MPELADQPIRVVVVDDHELVAEGLVRVLREHADIEVVGMAGSVAAGVALVESALPDVAIVDYQLQDGDGAAAAARFRAASPDTRVLMVTGSTREHVVVAAVEAGCAGFLTKDNAVKELVSAVRAVHSGEGYLSTPALAGLLPRLGRRYRRVGADLTPREREVLEALALGLSNREIAARLYLSVNTVRNHVQNVLAKLGAHSKLEAVAIAGREGLVDRTA